VRVNDRRAHRCPARRRHQRRHAQLTVLRAWTSSTVSASAVAELLGEGRTDASGDRTQGAGLAPAQVDAVLGFVGAGGGTRADVIGRLGELVGSDEVGRAGEDELARMAELLDASGLADDQVVFDPTVVRVATTPARSSRPSSPPDRGREGPKAQLDRSRRRSLRRPRRAVHRRAGPLPAGASIASDRLLAALRALHGEQAAPRRPVVVTVMDRPPAAYQAMVAELRGCWHPELYPTSARSRRR
jgi:histidyl-tRNA synthetase